MMQEVGFAKKLTTAQLGFTKQELQELTKEKGKKDLYSVLALVTGKKVEANRLQPDKVSTRFMGTFEVTNLIDGTQQYGAQAFFPGPAEAFLDAQLIADENGNFRPVKQAFIVTIEQDTAPNSALGYKFGVRTFVDKEAGNDPFKDLRALLPAPKSAAPKAIEAPAAKPAKK